MPHTVYRLYLAHRLFQERPDRQTGPLRVRWTRYLANPVYRVILRRQRLKQSTNVSQTLLPLPYQVYRPVSLRQRCGRISLSGQIDLPLHNVPV